MLEREQKRALQLELANREYQQLQIGILQSIDVRLCTKPIERDRTVTPSSSCLGQQHHAILPFPARSVTSTIKKTLTRHATLNVNSGNIQSNHIEALSWPTLSNLATEINSFVSFPRMFWNTKGNNIIPYGSSRFRSISMGDISAIQTYFQMGLLSPTHRLPSGKSIFEVDLIQSLFYCTTEF